MSLPQRDWVEKTVHAVEDHWLSGKEKIPGAIKKVMLTVFLEHERNHHDWFAWKKCNCSQCFLLPTPQDIFYLIYWINSYKERIKIYFVFKYDYFLNSAGVSLVRIELITLGNFLRHNFVHHPAIIDTWVRGNAWKSPRYRPLIAMSIHLYCLTTNYPCRHLIDCFLCHK